jgi:hypothetical protein
MAQQADQAASGGAPFAKFASLGDTLVGAFAGGKARQQIDFDKGTPKWKDEAARKPLLEEVMHFVAMPGTTAGIGKLEEGLTPIAVSDHVRFSVSGFKWGQVIDQRKALPEYAGFKAGTSCSGDVYTITLAGWSVATDNAQGAVNAGFTVVENRIILRSQEDKDKYVLAKSRNGGNANVGKDYEITIRRPTTGEKRFEQEADALFATKPWEKQMAMAGADEQPAEEPF